MIIVKAPRSLSFAFLSTKKSENQNQNWISKYYIPLQGLNFEIIRRPLQAKSNYIVMGWALIFWSDHLFQLTCEKCTLIKTKALLANQEQEMLHNIIVAAGI